MPTGCLWTDEPEERGGVRAVYQKTQPPLTGGCVFHCPTGPNDTMLPLTGPAFYPFLFPSFTASRNTLDGLKAGMEWAGITIVVFFVMLRATFSALFLTMKLPNPRKNTSSPAIIVSFMFLINASTTASAAVFSTPV